MPRFAANLSMLFNEYPFIERFDRAALAGFEAIEFMFPYAEDIPAVRDALTRNNLTMALFNMPPGDWAAGERGIASDPRRIEEFRESLKRALEIAVLLDAEKLNCLAGLRINEITPDVQLGTYKENLIYAADHALIAGIKLVFEPLNNYDNRGDFSRPGERRFEIAPGTQSSEPGGAIRRLSRPANGRKSVRHDQAAKRTNRPRSDRRQSLPS